MRNNSDFSMMKHQMTANWYVYTLRVIDAL
jgi:hypothetical protein